MPEDLAERLVLAAKSCRGAYNGAILAKDRELVCEVWRAYSLGDSQRAIAARLGIDRRSVRNLIEQGEAAGEIPPLKERITKRVGQAAEAGVEQLLEAVEDGEIAASQLPVGVAILIDKMQVLGGAPTSIVEHRRDVTKEDLDAYLAQLPEASTPED